MKKIVNASPLIVGEFEHGITLKGLMEKLPPHYQLYTPSINRGNKSIRGPMAKLLVNDVVTFKIKEHIDFQKLIVYENAKYIVIDKPYGMPSQPGCHTTISIDTIAKSYSMQHNITELKLCHRLDSATTGLMVFAKGKQNVQLFQTSSILKFYLTICEHTRHNPIWHAIYPINQNEFKSSEEGNSCQFNDAKRNMTYGKPIKQINIDSKLCNIWLFCIMHGFTHQIRKACKFGLNCPIIGDKYYSKTGDQKMILHSYMLKPFQKASPLLFDSSRFILHTKLLPCLEKEITKEEILAESNTIIIND